MKNKISKFIIKNKLTLLLLGIHIFGIFFFFGAINFFNYDPIYNYDYPFHLYYCEIAKNYHTSGHSWGYNPFFRAGHPWLNLDNELLQLVCTFIPFISNITLIKIWVVLFLFLLPILIYQSSLNFRFSKKAALISTLLSIIYLYNNYFVNEIIYYGMFNFLFSNCFALFYLSMFYRYIVKKEKKTAIFLLLTFPFIPLMHSSMLITFFIPFLLLYLINIRKLSLKNNLVILTPIIISSLILFFWIALPFFNNVMSSLLSTTQFFQIQNFKQLLIDFYCNSFDKCPLEGYDFIKLPLILIGLLGIFKWHKKDKLFYLFLPFSIILFMIIYLHNIIPIFNFISNIHPYKYIVTLMLFLTIPAGSCIINFYKKINLKKFNLKTAFFILFLALISIQIIYTQTLSQPMHGLFTDTPKNYLELKNKVKEKTSNQGRILIEMDIKPKNMFDKPSILYGLLSLETGRQLLGGPHIYPTTKYDFPALTFKRVFNKEWSLSDEELSTYLDLYNVGWIIARSRETRTHLSEKYLKNTSLFKSRDRFSLNYYEGEKYYKFHLYEVNRNLSFIIGGTADVEADFNKIKVKNLKTKNNGIILKYHYHPTLKATNGLKLEPVYMQDIPIPFIKVLGINTNEFEIYNSYKS